MSKKCPVCEKVFNDDTITECPDCGKELVPIPMQEEVKQISVFSLTSEESAQGVINYMKEQGVEGSYQYSLREKTYKIYVAQTDARAALKACTTYYAEEAKRIKAEEEKRRQEEEELRRQQEEEAERLRLEEEARLAAEEAERLRLEEEARLAAEEAERLAREEEERRLREEEEARRAAEEAERLAREEEERRLREEQEALLRAAEEAERLAREEEERLLREEQERLEAEKRAREEEAKRAAEEAERLRLEEEEKKKEKIAKRKMLFEETFREAEAKKEEELRKDPNYIPKVMGETVSDNKFTGSFDDIFDEDIFSESGPIFVETTPVDEYEVGDTIVVDAIDVDPNEENVVEDTTPSFDDFFANLNKKSPIKFNENEESSSNESNQSRDDFFASFNTPKKEENQSRDDFFANLNAPKEEPKQSREDFFASLNKTKEEAPVVEDLFTNNLFANKTSSTTASTASKDDSIEEVIDKNLNKSKPTFDFKKIDSIDDIDDGGYKGFVPDYHQAEEKVDPDAVLAENYGFSVEEYKNLKEKTAQKVHDRKANPVKTKKETKDFKIIDDDLKVDEYQGFIPDYASKKGLENMTFYTSSTKVDYSKYKTKNANDSKNSLGGLYATLRSASTTELGKLFDIDVVNVSASTKDITDLKSNTYLLALTGSQLNQLLNAWLITNVTAMTVKQFETGTGLGEDNYAKKIEGIKNLLKQNFGKLDDNILDIIVKTFYNKYLDE